MSERALPEAYGPLLSLSSLALTIEMQFDERPAGFNCPSANKIQSYCDASDPYAATAVTLRLTRATVPSTVHGLLLSSKLSFLHLSDLLKSAMWI